MKRESVHGLLIDRESGMKGWVRGNALIARVIAGRLKPSVRTHLREKRALGRAGVMNAAIGGGTVQGSVWRRWDVHSYSSLLNGS